MAKKNEIKLHLTESFVYNYQRYFYPNKDWFIEKEREMLGINLSSILKPYKLKLSQYDYSTIQDIKDCIDDFKNAKNMRVYGIINAIEFKQSNSGNYFYWIGIVDDRSFYKLYCNAKTFNEFARHIIKGNCVLFNVNISGNFVSFDKAVSISEIPFRNGYAFILNIPFNKHNKESLNYIEDEIDVSINKGNVEVYYKTKPTEIMISPTIDLIDIMKDKFGVKCTFEKIDDYMPNQGKDLIKYYEQNEWI